MSLSPVHSTRLAGRNPEFQFLLKGVVVNFDGKGLRIEWIYGDLNPKPMFPILSPLLTGFFSPVSIGAEGT